MRQCTALPGTPVCAYLPATLVRENKTRHSLRHRFGRRLVGMLSLLVLAASVQAQSTANYVFSTATNGSLVDMSSGTTQLIASSQDDAQSAITNLPFDFWFMGTRYTQFSVNSNGLIRLGGTAVGTTGNTQIGGTASAPLISPFSLDTKTSATGKVHYMVTGTAPNRVLAIEFLNMQIGWNSGTADGTYQALLGEDGSIRFIYGDMTYRYVPGTTTVSAGIQSSNTNNTYATINIGSNAVTTSGGTTNYNLGSTAPATIPVSSTDNSSRRVYTFTPTAPTAAPTNLQFTNTTALGMTLNWTAPTPLSNTAAYAIYSSTDNSSFTFAGSVPVGTNSFTASGLTPATNYFWKVYAVGEGSLSDALTGSNPTLIPAVYTSTATGGLWSQPATWVSGTVPGPGDEVTIVDGSTVIIDVNPVVSNLTIGEGTSGILVYNPNAAQTLTVTGQLTINSGGSFRAAAVGSTSTITTHALSIGGNLVNNGTIDFASTAGAGGTAVNASRVAVTFTGTGNNIFDLSNGTMANFAGVTVNKGTSAAATLTFSAPASFLSAAGAVSSGTTISVASTTGLTVGMYVSVVSGTGTFAAGTKVTAVNSGTQFTVSAAPTTALSANAVVLGSTVSNLSAASPGFLTLTNGTFVAGGTQAYKLPLFAAAAYTIPATGGLTVNNSNAVITGLNGSPTLNGKLTMTAGTYNVGTATGNSMGAAATANIQVTGGTINFAGRFNTANAITFNMSGGTINVTTVGNSSTTAAGLGITSTAASFTMSGGSINLVQASTGTTPYDYYVAAANPTITGGTLNVGTAATVTKFTFVIMGSMPNVVIDNTTNNKTAQLSATSPAIAYGDVLVNIGTTLNLNGTSLTERGTTLTNNGTINGSASGSRLSFLSAGAQTLAGSGAFTTPLDGLIVRSGGGLTISHASSFNTLRVELQNGTITNSNKIILGTGAALGVTVQTGYAGNTGPGGFFDVSPIFNLGTGTYTISAQQESVLRTLALEIPASRSIGALIVNNTNGVTFNGALSSGTLTLTAGNLNTSASNLLTVTGITAGSVSGGSAASYVNGPLQRTLPASLATGSTFSFPVGKSGYNGLDLVNPVTTAGGTVIVRAEAFDGNAGGTPGTMFSSLSTTRYWEVQVPSGNANFGSSLIRLNDTRGSFDAIGYSATQAGTYTLVGGASPTLAAGSITSTTPAVTSLAGFYLMALKSPPVLSNLTIAPTSVNCTTSSPHTVTVDVSGGSAPYSAVLTYTVNGGTPQNVTMTLSGSTFSGSIPSVTPAGATVAWSVTVTDANSLTSTITGTPYQDAPLVGVVPFLVASPTTVCAGQPVTLTANPSFRERFESFPVTTFAATAPLTATQSTAYFAEGSSAVRLTYADNMDAGYAMTQNFDLSGFSSAQLTFSHQAILEGYITSYDYGYVQYSTNGGATWTNFPTSSYAGSGTLFNSAVSFSTKSYSDWISTYTGATVVPNNNLWKNETINIPAAALTSQFRIRFRITSDGSVQYYGWMIDNVRIGLPGSGTFNSYLWQDGNSTTGNTYTYVPTTSENAAVLGVDANGCTTDISNLVPITVNALPAAPTAHNSTQCGLAVPTASVTSNTAAATPTFKWYDAATGGNLLQSGTSATYTSAISATTTFYVSELNSSTGCESARTAVTVSVTTPDPVTASSDVNNVCPGTVVTLTAQQTGNTQHYTYTWTASPAAGSGIPTNVTGASVPVTPTAGGTFVYTLTAVDGTCTASATVNVTITAPPAITSVTGTSPVCPGASIALAAQSVPAQNGTVALGTATGTNATTTSSAAAYPTWYGNGRQQYLVLASELRALGLVAGNLTSLGFDVVTANGDPATLNGYTIKLATTTATSISAFQAGSFTTVWGPQNYTPVVGINTHTFTTPFAWDGTSNLIVDICFSNSVTGNGSAQTKQTATSFSSSVYYAADGAGGSGACTTTTVSGSENMRPNMIFGGLAGVDLTSTYTWTWNPGGLTGASVTATAPANNTGAPITQVYTVTATNSTTGCSSSATVNVTVNATPATPTATNSNQCGLAVPTASVASNSGLATPTFNWYAAPTGGTAVQTGTQTTYQTAISTTTTFYVSEVNTATGCESSRVPVTITVAAPDPVTASAGGPVCPNTAASLSVVQNGSTQNYTYTWTASPVAGSGIPTSISGATVSVTPTASGTYTYTVTAVDGSCTASSTVNLTVKPSPVITTATATPGTICPGGSVALAATSIGVGAGTASIGAGATTTSTYPAPFYSLWSNKHEQIMFRASELTAANLRAGNITALNFPTTSGTIAIQNVTIKMANTTQTDLSTFVSSGFTTVFTAASLAQTANTNNRVVLSTPFNWDGTSNVVIEICFGTASSSATLSSTSPADVTSFTSVIKTHISAATAAATVCGNTTTNLLTYTTRPKVILEGQAVSNITSNYTWTWNPGNLTGASVTTTAPANNTGAPITQAYTVTANDAANGCSTSAVVNVTVNPTPNAPTATNSTQCGYGVPTASVASNTGVATPSFSWYAAPTGGTALQTGTQTTYQTAINATTTFYVSEVNTTTGCESARVPVTVTVNQPDAITAAANAGTVCANGAVNLTVTQTGNTQNYTYTWTASPVAGSGIPSSASGAAVTVNPTAAGTYVYTVTGVSGACTTFSTVSVTVNPNPLITSATGPSSAVCPGSAVALSAQSVPAQNGTVALGTATGTNGTTTSSAAAYPTWFGNGRQQYLVLASELQALGVVPGNLTSIAFDVVTANGDPATLNGYTIKLATTTATSITAFQAGSFTTVWGPQNYTPVVGINTHTFTTPFAWDGTSNLIVDICFSNSVTGNGSAQTKQTATSFSSSVYYAADGAGGSGACTSTSVSGSASMRPNMIFGARVGNVLTGNYTWTWNPGGLTGASITATAPANNTGAPITQVYTVTATNATTGCASSATVNVTVNATPATPTATNSTQCGVAVPTASVASNSGLATPTFNWYAAPTGGTAVQTGTQTTYQTAINATTTFYVSEVNTTTGCESARVPVTANVTQPDAVTASANSPICLGSAVNLSATQTGSSNNYTYTWTGSPAAGSGLGAPVTGATQTVTPTAAGTYTYTVTAFDPAGSCTVISSANVTVNPNPAITSISANPTLVCSGGTITLTASSNNVVAGSTGIGAGATTTSTYNAPFYSLWSNKHMQIMIKASELTAANLRAGNITALNFPTTAGTIAIQNVTIKLAQTAQADMSTFLTSGLTTVFTAPSLAQTANTDNRVALTTPFNWDGTSNLVIDLCFYNPSSTATLSSTSPADVTSYTSVIKTHVTSAATSPTICGDVTTNLLTYTTRPRIIVEGQVNTDVTGTLNWTWNPGNLSGAQVIAPAPTTGGVQTYTVRATNASTGCFATDSVSVTVGGAFTVAASSSPATICAGSSATLTAVPTGTGVPYTYAWTDASNTNLGSSATLTVSPATTSVYTVTVTNFCGTSVSQQVTVNVNPIPQTTPSLLAQTVCSGAATALNFSTQATGGSTTYAWTNSNPSIGLPASGSGNISFTAANATGTVQTATITVTASYSNGGTTCTGPAATATIAVNPNPTVNPVADQTLCAGTSTTAIAFNGSPAGITYSWTNSAPSIGIPASGTGNIASFAATNSGSSPVTAIITVTPQFTGGSQTCPGRPDTFSITVNPMPTGTITAPNGTLICQGTAVPLQVTGGTSYQWFFNGNPITGATGSSYSAAQVGTYTVNITNAQGCTGPASNSITVGSVQAPVADFTFNSYCVNSPVQFTNTTTTSATIPVDYSWSFGDGGTSTQTSPTHSFASVGNYSVRLVASYSGCPSLNDTVTKTIGIEAPLPGQRLATIDVVANRPTEIHARNLPNAHYSWTPTTGLSNPALWYPVATLSQEQEYRIQMSFNSGCITVDTLLVRVQKGDDIFVPTAFSPDGDGVNDVLRPITVGLSTFRSFHIYDRMGRELFATNQINQGWDGTLRGTALPAETYIWVVEGRDSNGQIIRKTGQVVLVR
ncbi:Ig-like domain-containing protein [Flaviaesturariibacter terrae]